MNRKLPYTNISIGILVLNAFLFSFPEFYYMAVGDSDFDFSYLMVPHQVLEGQQFWTSKSRDAIECAIMCLRRKLCCSFNFDTNEGVCELNLNATKTLQGKAGMFFSEISSWPSQVDPACYNRPCEEDEVCIPSYLVAGSSCSYTCIKLYRRCPLPTDTYSNQTRTVGSMYNFTCDHGYVGGDTAVCLPSGQWNKTMDFTCKPVYGSTCQDNEDCAAINGVCSIESNCTCPSTHIYSVGDVKCMKDCNDPWLLFADMCYFFGNASLTSNFTQAEEFCINQNASLVEVNTVDELHFIKDEIITNNRSVISFWTDLYQFGDEDGTERWKTSNNSLDPQGRALRTTISRHLDSLEDILAFRMPKRPLTIKNDWYDGEPNLPNERCTVFHGNFQYKFVDDKCDVPINMPAPICEK